MELTGNELVFMNGKVIVSKTDLKGKIIYGNKYFIYISGYDEMELLGEPHNILRHEKMPAVIFKLLWEYVQSGREIFAYVVNKTKSGDYYWVFANVTPSYDLQGNIIGYLSVRRKPAEKSIETIKTIYDKLYRAEKESGIGESERILKTLLEEQGMTYEQFILTV